MRRLLLVGGGHAHLYVLKQLRNHRIKDVEVILLSPHQFQYYSGMFSGYAEGLYTEEDIRIDLQKEAKRSRVSFMEDRLLSFDPSAKRVLTERGQVLGYDVISFDIGSKSFGPTDAMAAQYATTIKPNYVYTEAIHTLRSARKAVVVGAGVAGIELALSMQSWRKKNHINGPVTLISSGKLLEEQSKQVAKKIKKIVLKSGIDLVEDTRVTEIDDTHLLTDGGVSIEYDEVLWLTGPKAFDLFGKSKVSVDKRGFMLVNDFLQSPNFPSVFGAGDCVTLESHESLPKNGVYAIRQAPILYQNLIGFLEKKDGVIFSPQKRYLSILSISEKEGLLLYSKVHAAGRWPWLLKNYIDRNYMKSFT